MYAMTIRLYSQQNKVVRELHHNSSSNQLTLGDGFFHNLFKRDGLKGLGMEDFEAMELSLVCENLIIDARGYTLGPKLHIRKASDGAADISIFRSASVHLHLVGLQIAKLQTFDCNVLLGDCQVGRYDHELANPFNELQEKEQDRIHELYEIDIRSSSIHNLYLFRSVDYFNVQESQIENMVLFQNPSNTLRVRNLHIWQTTRIEVLRLGCELEMFHVEDSNIAKLYFISNSFIGQLTLRHSYFDKVFGSRYEQFGTLGEEQLKLVRQAAAHEDDSLYFDASYKLAELRSRHKNPLVNFFFKHAIGYGYKPKKGFLFIVLNILGFGLLYALMDGIEYLIEGGALVLDGSTLASAAVHVLDRIYFSGITFTTTGYGDIVPHNWAVKLLTIVESSMGVVLYSLLIFSLTVRYFKE